MSFQCIRTKKDNYGEQLRDRDGYLINFDPDGKLYSRCYITGCYNTHDSDYYHGPVPCNLTFGLESRCSNYSCPRFHFKDDVRSMAKHLDSKQVLNFLEIFTPDQFRFVWTIEEQNDFYEKYKMKRAYKPYDFKPVPAALPTPAHAPTSAPLSALALAALPAPSSVLAAMPAPALAPALLPTPAPVSSFVMPDMAKMFELFMQQQMMNTFMATMTAPGMPSFVPGNTSSMSSSIQMPSLPPAPASAAAASAVPAPAATAAQMVIPPPPPPPAGYVPPTSHVSDAARRMIQHAIRHSDEASTASAAKPATNTESFETSSGSGNWYFDGRDMRGTRITVVRNPRDRSRSRERNPSRYGKY
jgi:hypothetical protein